MYVCIYLCLYVYMFASLNKALRLSVCPPPDQNNRYFINSYIGLAICVCRNARIEGIEIRCVRYILY